MMKFPFVYLILSFLLVGCSKNLVTGRKQLSLVSESELQVMALKEYNTFLSENKVVGANSKDDDMVRRVGTQIAFAIKAFYDSKGQTSVLEGYQWEFNLIESKEINAWCMPGGKVVVYTGLLAVTKNESALAIVLGHEIAHAVAQHGSERMSHGLLQQLGGAALQIALANKPVETQNLFSMAYGISTTVGAILPFSRKEESEADEYGLYFAAMGGYNPQEAVAFWERMSAAGGSKPPEFLSGHPSDKSRITKIKSIMPQAMKYYNDSKK